MPDIPAVNRKTATLVAATVQKVIFTNRGKGQLKVKTTVAGVYFNAGPATVPVATQGTNEEYFVAPGEDPMLVAINRGAAGADQVTEVSLISPGAAVVSVEMI